MRVDAEKGDKNCQEDYRPVYLSLFYTKQTYELGMH